MAGGVARDAPRESTLHRVHLMRKSTTASDKVNPWLKVPLEDYERHMDLPEIGQAMMLNEALAVSVREFRPKSVAIAGCAGGNGIVRIAAMGVARIAGIDLNPQYLAAVHQRLGSWVPGLELHLADIQTGVPECAPVELVFAGLILEYVDVAATLNVLRTLSAPGGVLVIVLQRPCETKPAVSDSPYRSLMALESIMHLRDPDAVASAAQDAGFTAIASRRVTLDSGKAFEILSFRA